MVASTLPGPYHLAYSDWCKLPDDGRLYEILHGELLVSPPPSVRHQRISRDLHVRLFDHVRTTGVGEVFYSPVGLRLRDDVVLEPDLLVVLDPDRIGEQVIDGPVDVVVEILSPGTAARDLGPKRRAYQEGGVREYWIVDPEAGSIEVLALVDGSYARSGTYRRGDRLQSAVLEGFSVAVRDVL